MKSKCTALSFLCFVFLLASCAARLNISVENNSTNPQDPQVFYWVNNNTGAEIKDVKWTLNGVYFYTADLPMDGDHLDLFDFAKSDGTYYDYFSVKPLELKAKCSKGSYSIKFDDIPFDFSGMILHADDYTSEKEVYSWSPEFFAKNKTADGAEVSFSVCFGYKSYDDTTPAEIEKCKDVIPDYLHRYIAEKSVADFSPKNEEALKSEIENAINDEIFISGRVRDVRFVNLNVAE